jgi:hypothetical protein
MTPAQSNPSATAKRPVASQPEVQRKQTPLANPADKSATSERRLAMFRVSVNRRGRLGMGLLAEEALR